MKWRCTWCGAIEDHDDPPCDACGHTSFEPVTDETETVDTGPNIVWTCPNCDRNHVRNSPPCARCGNPVLEKRERTYDDVESELHSDSWIAISKPYLPIFALVIIVVGALLIGVPLLSDGEESDVTVPDAPGDGNEYDGIDLDSLAQSIHVELADQRTESGYSGGEFDEHLTTYATYLNRLEVIAAIDGDYHDSPDVSAFDPQCSTAVRIDHDHQSGLDPTDYPTENVFAQAIVAEYLGHERAEVSTVRPIDREGIDVHIGPDETLYLTVVTATC